MQDLIRPLYPTDVKEFKKLRLNSLKEDSFSWLATFEEEKDLPDFSFQQKIQYATQQPIFGFYGFFENGYLLGYAQIAPSYWKKKKHIATLYDVCVAKDVRRKNVGNRLLNYMIQKARAIGYVEQINLMVNSGNTGAISFYEKLGFKKIANHPNAVKEMNGTYQDEILYSLQLFKH
jgi:ribosomal protein S18 acetylase RimI-like enzyme